MQQEEESISHLLLHRMFAHEVWTAILHSLGKLDWMPTSNQSFSEWCAGRGTSGQYKRTTNALIILVMWEIWKHRNAIIFEGATPCKNSVILRISQEGRMWKQAGLLKGELITFFSDVEGWVTAAS